VDHDGGVVRTRVTDDEGQPAGNATVILIPKEATTLLRLAETRVVNKADQNGECTLASLAPGAYFALATEEDLQDLSPETIAALFNARSKAKEIQVGANATVDLVLERTELIR
jgi:hypothetical protein